MALQAFSPARLWLELQPSDASVRLAVTFRIVNWLRCMQPTESAGGSQVLERRRIPSAQSV